MKSSPYRHTNTFINPYTMYKCLKYLAHLATKQFGSLLTITYEGLLNWQIGKAFRKNSIVSVFTLSHIPTTPTNKMKSDRFKLNFRKQLGIWKVCTRFLCSWWSSHKSCGSMNLVHDLVRMWADSGCLHLQLLYVILILKFYNIRHIKVRIWHIG